MIAQRPTLPVTISISALEQTRVMAALLRRYLYPEKTSNGPGKNERVAFTYDNIPKSKSQNNTESGKQKSTLAQRLLSHTAGLVVLYTYALVILVNGGWKLGMGKVAQERRKRLIANRISLWSLDREPYIGVRHRFHTDGGTGLRMHYVEAGDMTHGSELIILIHGFPDSYYSYRHQLTSPNLHRAHVIALDLPGFGGSDSLPEYSSTNVLNAISSFIIDMKKRKTHERCILVGHDWGALIVCRLVSEGPGGLVSRAIIMSGLHPAILKENTEHNLASFSRTAKSTIFVHHPLHVLFSPGRAKKDIARIRRSWQKNISPLLNQARHSHYIIPLRLPWMFMARRLPMMGDYWFLRRVSKLAKCNEESSFLANALGPGKAECEGIPGESGYPDSVRERKDGGEVDEMIGYYRDGLAFGIWEWSITVQEFSERQAALQRLQQDAEKSMAQQQQQEEENNTRPRRRRRTRGESGDRDRDRGERRSSRSSRSSRRHHHHHHHHQHLNSDLPPPSPSSHPQPPSTSSSAFSAYSSSTTTTTNTTTTSRRRRSSSSNHHHHRSETPSPPPESCFNCPVIALWGSRDTFYSPELVHHGWGRYFYRPTSRQTDYGSATVILNKSGHWVHVGSRGREVVNGILEWSITEAEETGKRTTKGKYDEGESSGSREKVEGRRSRSSGDVNVDGVPDSEERRRRVGEGIRNLKKLVGEWYSGEAGEEAEFTCY
ncbi:hypothetical protein DFH27DRAFT_188121 [Peziza echinospora]|nr:hypothetical protein DFH27DRAFT_188121 [Peziza echinospora]